MKKFEYISGSQKPKCYDSVTGKEIKNIENGFIIKGKVHRASFDIDGNPVEESLVENMILSKVSLLKHFGFTENELREYLGLGPIVAIGYGYTGMQGGTGIVGIVGASGVQGTYEK